MANSINFETLKRNGAEAGKHLLMSGKFAVEAAYVGGTMAVRGLKNSERVQNTVSQAKVKFDEAKAKVEDKPETDTPSTETPNTHNS